MSVESLKKLALTQEGVVTAHQAKAHVSKDQLHRLVKNGAFRREVGGVYLLAIAPLTWRQKAIAATWSVRGGALSGLAAAKWWGLTKISKPPIRILTNGSSRSIKREFAVVSSATFSRQVITRQGIQVTTVERTLIDIAALVTTRQLRSIVDEALFQRLTTVPRIEGEMRRMPRGTNGLPAIRADLARRNEADRKLQSRFEREVLIRLRNAGVPQPIAQHKVMVGDATYFPDFCWPDKKLVVEVDGGHHDHPEQVRRDRLRRNDLLTEGFRVMHYGDETNGERFIEQLLALWGS